MGRISDLNYSNLPKSHSSPLSLFSGKYERGTQPRRSRLILLTCAYGYPTDNSRLFTASDIIGCQQTTTVTFYPTTVKFSAERACCDPFLFLIKEMCVSLLHLWES